MLTEAQLNTLPPADRARATDLELLFAQPGWKYVVALAKQNVQSLMQRAALAQSWADNRLAVGNMAAWEQIAALEDQTEAHYTQKLTELEQALQLIDEDQFE